MIVRPHRRSHAGGLTRQCGADSIATRRRTSTEGATRSTHSAVDFGRRLRIRVRTAPKPTAWPWDTYCRTETYESLLRLIRTLVQPFSVAAGEILLFDSNGGVSFEPWAASADATRARLPEWLSCGIERDTSAPCRDDRPIFDDPLHSRTPFAGGSAPMRESTSESSRGE